MAHFFGFTSNKTVTERFPLFDSGFNPEWTPPVMTGGVQLHLLYSGKAIKQNSIQKVFKNERVLCKMLQACFKASECVYSSASKHSGRPKCFGKSYILFERFLAGILFWEFQKRQVAS